MSNGILERVDSSLASFRPRNQREFVALQIARRFHDTRRLARYVLAAQGHPKRLMLEAARVALLRRNLNRTSLGDLFFEVLNEYDQEERR
jgi:hypothetical protein